jgi:DNA-binding response OmpR family regulator
VPPSARGEKKNVEAAQAAGASEYVTKPIAGKDLLAKIEKCLRSPT